MKYKVREDPTNRNLFIIDLPFELVHRQSCQYLSTTPMNQCPGVVNDIFDELPGVQKVVLLPYQMKVLLAPLISWVHIESRLIQLIQINYEPDGRELNNVDQPGQMYISPVMRETESILAEARQPHEEPKLIQYHVDLKDLTDD